MINISLKMAVLRFTLTKRSGGGVVDNTLDYQSRGARSIARFSGLSDETLNRGPVSV